MHARASQSGEINVMPARTSNSNNNESTTQQSQCNTLDQTQPYQGNKAEREKGRTVYLSDRSHDMQEKSKTHPHLLISYIQIFLVFLWYAFILILILLSSRYVSFQIPHPLLLSLLFVHHSLSTMTKHPPGTG